MMEFGDLRLVWLQAFVQVADSKKRTAAADEMGIHQGTVTKHVQKLEQWLGGRMLLDDNVPVGLYPDGQKFLPVARQVLALLKEAQKLPEPVEVAPVKPVDTKTLRVPGIDRTRKDG
jgi:DNA-binding transcriptional LysR family regulator